MRTIILKRLKKLKKSKVGRYGIRAAGTVVSLLNRRLPNCVRIRLSWLNPTRTLEDYERELAAARRACESKPEDQQCLDQLSRVLGRLERWDEAAEVLARTHVVSEAFEFRTKSVDRAAEVFFKNAQEHGLAGEWDAAAAAVSKALDRSDSKRDSLAIDFARILAISGDGDGAARAFRHAAIERAAAGAFKRGFNHNVEVVRTRCYAIYFQSADRRADVVMYESFHGKNVACNPAAMLYAALNDPWFKGFTHVVVLNDSAKLPAQLAEREDVVIVRRESNRYRYFLSHARYLINNNTFPSYFIRKPFQKYLNTWHGTPMKTLGRFVAGAYGEHRNAQHNFLHATHVLAQNEFTAEKLIRSHDIPCAFKGRFAVTGYPRVDAVINATADSKELLRRRLAVPPGCKVILFAPTWRGRLGAREEAGDPTRKALEALCSTYGGRVAVLYRGHHLTVEGTAIPESVPWIEPDEIIDTNDLLSITDILVSDYSSIIFDFMPLRKPLVLYAFDQEEYAQSRGFFIEPENLGVPICRSLEQLVSEVNDARVGDDSIAAIYSDVEDGGSTRRAMDFFFRDDDSLVISRERERPTILFFGGGFKKNGVTVSLLSRLNSINNDKFEVILVTMTAHMSEDADKMLHFGRVHPSVKIIDRGGRTCASPIEHLKSQRAAELPHIPDDVCELYKREALRVFGGGLEFDVAIDYGGYSHFWSLLIGCTVANRRVIYLHNDMVAERDMRFPELSSVFSCYPLFDRFVSVSASSAAVNRAALAEIAGNRPNAFVHVTNPIDYRAILDRADEDSEVLLAPRTRGTRRKPPRNEQKELRFVNVARLSPEKGHERLLRAFARVYQSERGIKLYLVGDGPLRLKLERLARRLGIGRAVHFLGLVDNPLPIVKACDVFVFSSIHEGQGLALIEALILQRPAISTDIPGPNDVLADGLGMLVPDSEDGLVGGLLASINGWSPERRFDGAAYNTQSELLFEDVLFGPLNADSSR